MIRLRILILSTALSVPSLLPSQETPYAGLETRSIKALSAEQISEYLQGSGMGFALTAELNGYPGPKHVLELAEELSLTSRQRSSVQQVFDQMHDFAVELGERIVEREEELDELFVSGMIDEESLRDHLIEIGGLGGELRAVHLAAHLETKSLLTGEQIEAYNHRRGYQTHPVSDDHHHSGHDGK